MGGTVILRRLQTLAVVAFAAFAVYQCAYVPIHCSREVWRSEQALAAAAERGDRSLEANAANQALRRLQPCGESRPLDVNVPMLVALSYRFLLRHDLAVKAYEDALAIDRRPEIYLGLGSEQLQAGRREEAVNSLFQACSFDPRILDAIDDGQARLEVRKRLVAAYGESWFQ